MLRARIVFPLVLLFLPASLAASTDFLVPPGPQDNPLGIVTGPDLNLWFTNSNSRSIGRITPAGVITSFPVPGGVFPDQIAKGADGNLWFTDALADFVGRITTGGVITTFALRAGANPVGSTPAPANSGCASWVLAKLWWRSSIQPTRPPTISLNFCFLTSLILAASPAGPMETCGSPERLATALAPSPLMARNQRRPIC